MRVIRRIRIIRVIRITWVIGYKGSWSYSTYQGCCRLIGINRATRVLNTWKVKSSRAACVAITMRPKMLYEVYLGG